jgi:MFS superfamily sulfate permease-like transporter
MRSEFMLPSPPRARRSFMQVETILPIWADLRRYRREWLAHDLLAGLGIAAIAIPIGIAYPAIAGLPPVTASA